MNTVTGREMTCCSWIKRGHSDGDGCYMSTCVNLARRPTVLMTNTAETPEKDDPPTIECEKGFIFGIEYHSSIQ